MYRLLALLLVASCSSPAPVLTEETVEQKVEELREKPSRVIFFIGDGMGMNFVSAAAYANGGPLHMMSMPHFGSTTHHEYEHASTDSAASATALATGRKTHFEGVSVSPGTTKETEENSENHLETLMERAKQHGLGTGLVATSTITHATPAAFGAHRHSRDSLDEIAEDFVARKIDVMIGGGMRHFAGREDGVDLVSALKEAGYLVTDNAEDLNDPEHANKPLAALLTKGHMPPVLTGERPMALKDMAAHAIERLDRTNPQGWVLMVEGSQIDWCGHDMDSSCAIAETLDMDEAVGVALDYARARKDTLVVVTADHETGGLAVVSPDRTEPFIKHLGGVKKIEKSLELKKGGAPNAIYDVVLPNDGAWSWETPQTMTLLWGFLSQGSRPIWNEDKRFYAAHTITLVGVMAEGPGAREVVAVLDNADLGVVLKSLITDGAVASARTERRPKNVILMIADGLGHASMAAANYVHGDLKMRELPYQGYVSTHGTDRLVNDSAATATAMSTGLRTRYNAVGMVPQGANKLHPKDQVYAVLEPTITVLEEVEARGLKTGIVTTTQLTHATPAAFYAHVPQRSQTADIAKQFLTLSERIAGSDGVDIALGGGRADFVPADLKKAGYQILETMPDSAQVAEGRVIGLFAAQGLDGATERLNGNSPHPTLEAMTRFALDGLSPHQEGFFLVIEGGQVDWKLHDAARGMELIDEIVDFDLAVQAAREFVAKNPDTLLIVTSDHDHTISVIDNHYPFTGNRCGVDARCGGKFKPIELPVKHESIRNAEGFVDKNVRGDWADSVIMIQYAWLVQEARLRGATKSAPHSAHFVPLFAEGPWAHRFEGYLDQPEIGAILLEWARKQP